MTHTKLKKAMLAVLGRDGLKRIVEDLEIEGADRRSEESMRAAVSRARRATAEVIAEYLYETEVKEVCQALGVSDKGRRAAVVERLLSSIEGNHSDEPNQAAPPAPAGRLANEPPTVPTTRATSRPKPSARAKNNGANLGFERELWQSADALRSNMDAAEYKHVVLGLIFLKYISDAFEEKHAELEADRQSGADPEDPDEYRAVNIFWVPHEARWRYLLGQAKDPKIGKIVDDAMLAIERDNPTLKGVLPKDYAHPRLDKQRLGQLIDLIGNIGLGDKENRSKDILGRVYEYFLSRFASAEGKKGGQFYTPRCIVQVLVEMISPYKGRVYDPCCGSGGMFVQSVEFVNAHVSGNGNGGKARADISIFGQESNHTTWRLAKMNLAIRQIENNLGREHADSFHRDLHPDLRADFVLANPPFNDSDWRGELLKDDKRWKYGTPPAGNANFAWVQHFIYHLAPTGLAGFVLANPSMSSNQSGEGEIRKNIIEADLVDCMVALPGQLFYSTQIPVCLWFLARDKKGEGGRVKGENESSNFKLQTSLFKLQSPQGRDAVHRRPQAGDDDRPRPPRIDRRRHPHHRRHLPRMEKFEG